MSQTNQAEVQTKPVEIDEKGWGSIDPIAPQSVTLTDDPESQITWLHGDRKIKFDEQGNFIPIDTSGNLLSAHAESAVAHDLGQEAVQQIVPAPEQAPHNPAA